MFGIGADAPDSDAVPETATGGARRSSAELETGSRLDPDDARPAAERIDVSSRARALREIAHRIERFLAIQLDRLQSALETVHETETERHKLQQLREQLEQQRKAWEQERRAELQALADEADRLRAAWLSLEAEQRRLLARRQSSLPEPGTVTTASADRSCTPAGRSEAGTASPQAGSSHQSPETRLPTDVSDWPTEPTRFEGPTPEALLLQFQQLKREIRKHSQRHH